VGRELFAVASREPVPTGDHDLRFEFEPQGEPDLAQGHGMPGRFQLYVDNELVGSRDVPWTTPFAFNPGALTCGADPGSTVTDAYAAPFRFTGTLHKVTVDLSGELIQDKESELRVAMARQ
jgi:arylsulfatase